MSDNQAVLTIEETSKILRISKSLGYQLAREGRLPGLLIVGDKRKLVSRAKLEAFIAGEKCS